MLEALTAAADTFFNPFRFSMMLLGLLLGLVIGLIPGLGVIFAFAIVLPFIHQLDITTALALMTGIMAVVNTADNTTSVLIGIPGSAAAVPTSIEGYKMTQRGEAARALSAAYLSSLLGGIVGAIGLTLLIPVARPIALAFGSPELFMATVLAISLSASLLGGNRLKGILAALFGLLLGTIGPTPSSAVFRFRFNQLYLMDGLSIVLLALGLYGIAEVMPLLARGGSIARERLNLRQGWLLGVRDVITHFGMLIRGALIGVWAGILPILGGIAGTMMAYAHAASLSKENNQFGKGDVRGIIASEAAGNAVFGGDVVPTVFFSIPGSTAMAMLMSVLLAHGILPGPRFAAEHMDLLYVVIWTLAVGNVIGAALCFTATPLVARLTYVPFAAIAPVVIVAIAVGAYEVTRSRTDLLVLLILGVVGWLMKRGGWPRAPMLIGFIMAEPLERYFWLTVNLYLGYSWAIRPGVIIIALIIIAPFVWTWIRKAPRATATAAGVARGGLHLPAVFSLLLLAAFSVALIEGVNYPPDARLAPWLAAVPGAILAVVYLIQEVIGRSQVAAEDEEDSAPLAAQPSGLTAYSRELLALGGIALYFAAIFILGFRLATIVGMLTLLLGMARMRLRAAALYTAAILLLLHTFAYLLNINWPVGVFGL